LHDAEVIKLLTMFRRSCFQIKYCRMSNLKQSVNVRDSPLRKLRKKLIMSDGKRAAHAIGTRDPRARQKSCCLVLAAEGREINFSKFSRGE
jgi:hypothetical protein